MQEDDKPKPLIFHPAYEPLFAQLPKGVRYVLVTGSRNSGKSFGMSTACGVQMHNFGHRIIFTRYTLTSAKDSIIPEFKAKLDMLGIGGLYDVQKDRIDGPGNRKVIFRGLRSSSGDQSARLKSLSDFSCFVLDEAEECQDEKEFNKIDMSIRPNDVQSLVILILNPSVKTHWIYKRFFEKAGMPEGYDCIGTGEPYRIKGNTLYIHTTYLDNIDNIPEDYLGVIEEIKTTDPDRYRHEFLGKWDDASEGAILTNWRYAREDEFDWEDMDYDVHGLDFGWKDPDSMVSIKVQRKQRRILVRQRLYKNKLTTHELALTVKQLAAGGLIIADDSGARTIEDIRGYGVRIKKHPFGKGKIIDRIKLLQNYEIVISPDSTDLAMELNSWVWLDKATGKPIDRYNHQIDPLGYAAAFVIKPTGTGRGIRKISYKRK